MKTKHTPGPWIETANNFNFECDGRSDDAIEIISDEWHICEVHGSNGGVEANAKLIAAAPELLEALQKLIDCSPCQNGCAKDDMTCATRKAEAAITKATS